MSHAVGACLDNSSAQLRSCWHANPHIFTMQRGKSQLSVFGVTALRRWGEGRDFEICDETNGSGLYRTLQEPVSKVTATCSGLAANYDGGKEKCLKKTRTCSPF